MTSERAGGVCRRRSVLVAAAMVCLLVWVTPGCAGVADEVGATFGLMLQDVVLAFPAVEGRVVAVEGEQIYIDLT